MLIANQASHALFKRHYGLRHLLFEARIAAALLYCGLTCFSEWLIGNRERQLINDNAAQLFARHIDALPEA